MGSNIYYRSDLDKLEIFQYLSAPIWIQNGQMSNYRFLQSFMILFINEVDHKSYNADMK